MILKDFAMVIINIILSIATVGLIAWITYDKIFLKNISLKIALFKNESLPVWLDFIGGFLVPVLFLVATLMAPTGKIVYDGHWKDILVSIAYISSYTIIFAIFRYLADRIVKTIGKLQFKKEVSLEHEVFSQNNIAAALFSISISVVFISMILQENILNENIFSNLIRVSLVFLITLGLLSVYKTYFFQKHSSLFKELFIDHNICSGVLLLGHAIAVSLIVNSTINWFNAPSYSWFKLSFISDITLMICFIYLIMLVMVSVSKLIMNKILSININQELFEENNVGYALLESSYYILLSIIIINGILVK